MESIVIPQIYSHFFNVLNNKTKVDVFIKYIVFIIIIQFIVNISNAITTYIESYIIPDLNDYIINFIFKNILKKYENSYTDLELGKIIVRINSIPVHLKDLISDFLIWIFPRFITIIAINAYFFYINWKLGVASVLMLVVLYCITPSFYLKCSNISSERHALFEEKSELTMDRLSNSFSIYSSGNVDGEIKKYKTDIGKYISKHKENLECFFKTNTLSNFLIIVIYILLNVITTYLFIKKQISLSNLIAIFITIIYYIPCITTIENIMPDFAHCYGTLAEVDHFIKDLYDVNQREIEKEKSEYYEGNMEENKVKPMKTGTIIINNLTFGYNDKSTIFKNFYLTIKNNQKVAIVGHSGNGKSTLIKLIMGYYKVDDNEIYIDGKDINNYNLGNLRRQISYVNQNSKLFNMTVLENIQYGNELDREDVVKMCKKLKIESAFKNLNNGLDTICGVEGNNLSGGQKQIIHILRNIFKKNKIVILDEPTSAIDKENTGNIIQAIKELSNDKTLILITHDEILLSLVDRIITIDSGKIINDKYI